MDVEEILNHYIHERELAKENNYLINPCGACAIDLEGRRNENPLRLKSQSDSRRKGRIAFNINYKTGEMKVIT